MPSNHSDFEKISTLSRGASPVPVTSPHMCGFWWLLSILQYKKKINIIIYNIKDIIISNKVFLMQVAQASSAVSNLSVLVTGNPAIYHLITVLYLFLLLL